MSLIATRLQDWRINNPLLDKNMFRPSTYGALDFFVQQTNAAGGIINPELKQRAFQSIGNTVTVPVLNYDGNVQVSNVRTCTIADSENTSALYTVAWTTYQVGFTMVPTAYMNNEIGYQRDFNAKMNKVTAALAKTLDAAAVAALEAKKTQVFENLLYYTQSGNVVQIPWNMRTEIFGDLNPIMSANDYNGQIHIIGNYGTESILRKLAEHGLYNDVNKQLEYMDKVVHLTNNVADDTGKFGTFYAVEDGNVGILTRVDREALVNGKAAGHEWGRFIEPVTGLEMGYHYYEGVGDQSGTIGAATADLTCARKEYYGFSVDVAFIIAYNSAPSTIANPIIKGEITKGTSVGAPVVVTNTTSDPVNTLEVSE